VKNPRPNSTLRYLYDLQRFGIKSGLDNIRFITAALGHPERRFPSVHIAGTNGKGSTAAMLAAILTASGYRTGLYTSPHLVSFNERIRIDGVPISDRRLAALARLVRPLVDSSSATFFEATTAIAFSYFADEKVDIAVIETGLGGRLDATNVVTPLLSIITTVDFDHTEYLGNTISQIAREKGGIIKPGVPCLIGRVPAAGMKVLETTGRKNDAECIDVSKNTKLRILGSTLRGLKVSLSAGGIRSRHLVSSLAGEHQADNLRTAVLAAEFLRRRHNYRLVTFATVRDALSRIGQLTGMRGRMEVVREKPVLVLDVGHNPDGILHMANAFRRMTGRDAMVVLGVMKDKDYVGMLGRLKGIARKIVAVKPPNDRALPAKTLAVAARSAGFGAITGGNVPKGLMTAIREAREGEIILVTGSHYLVGDVLKCLKKIP
jgi:dihydrofolate synthase / folylpolyglutamate synthase